MRLAVISDIHGNPIALEAVLRDLEAQGGADAYWFIGDHSALGPDPVAPLERMTKLPNAHFTRGNTDRYTVVPTDRPAPTRDQVAADPRLIDQYAQVMGAFAWTQGYVTAAGWFDWLANLGLELRTTLPDGTRVLGVHASPGTDDGPGFNPKMGDDEVRGRLEGAEADLVIVGHVHYPLDRLTDGVELVVTGGVSNPMADDMRAKYVVVEADGSGHRVERRFVEYDRAAVIAALDRVRHPSSDFVASHFRGERHPPWG